MNVDLQNIFHYTSVDLDLVMLPLTPVNQRKDVQGCTALTPHLFPGHHIFTCSLCEHRWRAGNAAARKLGANLRRTQILCPLSTVLSPGYRSLLWSWSCTQVTLQGFQFWTKPGLSLDLHPFIQLILKCMWNIHFSKYIVNKNSIKTLFFENLL